MGAELGSNQSDNVCFIITMMNTVDSSQSLEFSRLQNMHCMGSFGVISSRKQGVYAVKCFIIIAQYLLHHMPLKQVIKAATVALSLHIILIERLYEPFELDSISEVRFDQQPLVCFCS